MQRKCTIANDHAKQGIKPANAQEIPHAPVLNDRPPQADAALRVPLNFSKFSPELRDNVTSADTSSAILRHVSEKRKRKHPHPTRPTGPGSPCAESARSTSDFDTAEDNFRVRRYIYSPRKVPVEVMPIGGKDRAGWKPNQITSFSDVEVERGVSLGRGMMDMDKSRKDYSGVCSPKSHSPRFLMRPNVIQTPSERLLAALPCKARRALAPLRRNKMDLSHVETRRWENAPTRRNLGKGLRAMTQGPGLLSSRPQPTKQISLSVILSRYITERSVSEDLALSKLHETETKDYLRSKGLSSEDVVAWNWILLSSDADEMVFKFVGKANDLSSSNGSYLPTFLLMFILRARSLKSTSLRLLLIYIFKNYVGERTESKTIATSRRISQGTAMILIVRLVRHARIVWPSALEEIAVLATQLIGRESRRVMNLGRQDIQGFSHLYNRLLALFAMPTSLRPVLSIAVQQRSQFCLVRKMTSFKPHLPVTREGFRALTKIQLAHKKTEEEKKWATSKALSWPPWKEELLGIEADSEDAGKTSRAADVLSRMSEAGYSHLPWEQTARVFAGWDTDGSPTIQTRTLLNPGPILRSADVKRQRKPSYVEEQNTWAARILATRTVKEAWACFTSYKKSSMKVDAIKPYEAMVLRLLHARKNDADQNSEITSVVPGDGKETWPEPTSPHDFLYVPSDPPSVNEFVDMMTKRGLKLGKSVLTELLDKAPTITAGARYINASRLRERERDALLGNTEKDEEQLRATVNTIADRVVAAFVRLLCRSQATRETNFALPRVSDSHITIPKETHTRDPFVYAQSFVSAVQPSYRPIWYALLQGLNHRISTTRPQALHQLWASLLNQIHKMDEIGIDLEFGGFKDIGEFLEESSLTNQLDIRRRAQEVSFDLQLNCVSLCKSLFHAMAYGGSVSSKHGLAQSTAWVPLDRSSALEDRTHLVDVPTPAVLHRTVRILGLGEDNASILTLVRWMHIFAPELSSVAGELANSKKLTRYAITAVRYFLEQSWRDDDFNLRAALRDDWHPGQKELLSEAQAILEQHRDDWGGWPTVEELYRYHYVNKKKAARLRERLGLKYYAI